MLSQMAPETVAVPSANGEQSFGCVDHFHLEPLGISPSPHHLNKTILASHGRFRKGAIRKRPPGTSRPRCPALADRSVLRTVASRTPSYHWWGKAGGELPGATLGLDERTQILNQPVKPRSIATEPRLTERTSRLGRTSRRVGPAHRRPAKIPRGRKASPPLRGQTECAQ